jgi:hypothetical protein
MTPSHGNPASPPPRIEAPDLLPGAKRKCNRHKDCNAADERVRADGRSSADHCHDDCCEDCFGQ